MPDERKSNIRSLRNLPGIGRRALVVGDGNDAPIADLIERGCTISTLAVEANLDFDRLPQIVGDERFDIILVGDVLEILHDPLRLLDDARRVLSDGGNLIVSLRNVAHGAIALSSKAGDFDYQSHGILGAAHLRFFTRSMIEVLLVRAGYATSGLDRVVVRLFEPSEALPAISEADFSPEDIAAVRADDEHETLLFIINATALDDPARDQQISRAYAAASARASELEDAVAVLEGRRYVLEREGLRATIHIAELDELRLRSLDEVHALEEELHVAEAARTESDAKSDALIETFQALTNRFEALTAERAIVDAHCLRISQALAAARGRTLIAERELHHRLRPLTDSFGSLASAEREALLQRGIRARVSVLLEQLDSLGARVHAHEAHIAAIRSRPLRRLKRRVLALVQPHAQT